MLYGKLSTFPKYTIGDKPKARTRMLAKLAYAASEGDTRVLGQDCISWAEGCSFAHIFWSNRIHSHSASSRTCPELGPTIKGAGQSSKTSKSSKTSARGTHPESSDLRERAQRHQLGDLFLSCSPFPYVTWFMGS